MMKKMVVFCLFIGLLLLCTPVFAATNLQGDWFAIESNSTLHLEQVGTEINGVYTWHGKIPLQITGTIYQDVVVLKMKFDTPEKIQIHQSAYRMSFPLKAAQQAEGAESLLVARVVNNDLLSGIWIDPNIQLDAQGDVCSIGNGGSKSSAFRLGPSSGMTYARKK